MVPGSSLSSRYLFAILLIFLCSSLTFAQSSTGSLRGSVEDSTGARISQASVLLRSTESPLTRSGNSGPRGEFRVDALPTGSYQLEVSAKGFATASAPVTISVGGTLDVQVQLLPAGDKQVVTVSGKSSSIVTTPLDASNTVVQSLVSPKDINEMPLAHRSFANIAYLAPTTEPVEPSDPTKARITAVAFGGSSGLNVNLEVDGADNNDDYIGGFLQNFSPDSIEEFGVRTSQMDADTGRTNGGSVLISTKRGTDEWHGSAAGYFRDSALNARFPIDNPSTEPKQPFSRQNFVGAIGGPVAKGKLYLFSSYEFVRENASVAYSTNSLNEFNALATLASDGLLPDVNSITVPSSVTVPFHENLFTIRADWNQSERSQWFARFGLDRYRTQNDLVQQGTLPNTGVTSDSKFFNVVVGNQYQFSPTTLGSLTLSAQNFHITRDPNSHLGYALAFPFSATFHTISGFETFGDNQFATPITAFPVERDQQKYQLRYDLTHVSGHHSFKVGVNFVHEPVLRGQLAGTSTLYVLPQDPSFYVDNPEQFVSDLADGAQPTGGAGPFAQSIRRVGFFASDSWRVSPRLTVNYGLRYDTTFGLFQAEGRSQSQNPGLLTLQALQIPLASSAPKDYRKAFGPRLGLAYALDPAAKTVLKLGGGVFFNDLYQNGWVDAFTAVNVAPGQCAQPGDPGCLPSAADGGQGAVIDPRYHTPYNIQASAAIEHAINKDWIVSATYQHHTGMHEYRRYEYAGGVTLNSPIAPGLEPNISLFKSDNRSVYDGVSFLVRGQMGKRFDLIAHYTLASAKTWGAVVGELSDYVNGVSDPRNPFGPGDYGPSGEDVRHRFVLAGELNLPWKIQVTTLAQFESARPFTLGTGTDINGDGISGDDRAVINGVQTTLDQFRGTPYQQVDLRVSKEFQFGERRSLRLFAEMFNLLNRSNPANNYVGDIAALPVPADQVDAGNVTSFCLNADCSQTRPITLADVRKPAGAVGDFFGPGTTVGIPFAAQFGLRFSF